MRKITFLYRLVGPSELALIEDSGWTRFPPRKREQPIFYPVLNQEYAAWISKNWGGLSHLRRLSGLTRLDLGGTKIGDAGLAHLEGLTKFRDLVLLYTRVGDAGLAHLKGMVNLQSLNIGSTAVTDAGLVHLKGLTGLQHLDPGGHRHHRRRARTPKRANRPPGDLLRLHASHRRRTGEPRRIGQP